MGGGRAQNISKSESIDERGKELRIFPSPKVYMGVLEPMWGERRERERERESSE